MKTQASFGRLRIWDWSVVITSMTQKTHTAIETISRSPLEKISMYPRYPIASLWRCDQTESRCAR